jgi:GTP-binding protein EngB required for normal cell division
MGESRGALKLFHDVRDQLAVILDELANVAEERDIEEIVRKDRVETQQKLADRLRERAKNVQNKETFKLAVVGEFNAGKSTFINALLRRELLSVSWKPSTATKTVLKYGEPERFRVSYQEDQRRSPIIRESMNLLEDLANFTSDPTIGDDEARLKNEVQSLAKQIKEVEVWCKADFLNKEEIDIVDTPGLGAVFTEHKEVTYSLIPEVDATMFLFPIDPGISEEDILFLRYVREHIKQIFFVMTKSDYARSRAEREERASFNHTTIRVKADFAEEEMRSIYPVSARMELERKDRSELSKVVDENDPSGFPKVVNELVRFLVSSSGAARLGAPLEFAREKWQLLFKETDKDIRDADKNLEMLKNELTFLENERNNVELAKNEILRDINISVQEMQIDATDGIEHLPLLLQQKVENAIDSYDRKQLQKANQNLPIVLKEGISSWVKEKETRFETRRTMLQSRVEKEMRRIVEQLEGLGSEPEGKRLTDFDTLLANKMFSRAAVKVGFGMAGKAGIAGLGAGGVVLAGLLVGFTLPVLLIIGAPVIAAIISGGGGALKYKEEMQKMLKDDLKKPLPPPNTNNIYDAVVKGGYEEGRIQPGLKETMTNTFIAWGNALEEEMKEWIANQIGSRITQLERHIREKESGKWNRESNLERYQLAMNQLREIEGNLTRVEMIVQNMINGKFREEQGDGEATSS